MRQKKKKKLSKSKKKNVQNFADVLRCVIFHADWGESLSFCRQLSAVALLVVQKFELKFEVMLNITIFYFLSPGSCFKSASLYSKPT